MQYNRIVGIAILCSSFVYVTYLRYGAKDQYAD